MVIGADLGRLLEEVMEGYPSARKEPLASHPMAQLVTHDLADLLRDAVAHERFAVKGGVGVGKFAEVAWVAVLDRQVTTSVKTGFFVCYFFHVDGDCVYLSLNQGTTEAMDEHHDRYLAALADQAREWVLRLGPVQSFAPGPIDLAASRPITRGYESGSVYAKRYQRGDVPTADVLENDFDRIMRIYNKLAALPAATRA